MNMTNNNNNNSNDSVDVGEQDYTTTTTTTTTDRRKSLSALSAAAAAANKRQQHKANKEQRQQQIAKKKSNSKPIVRSPSNRALVQSDPLFHLYLICVGLITLSILAIKWLIPGMPIYAHTVIGFAFLLAIIVLSIIYTQFKSRKINIQFRILLWLIISASLTMLQLVDLIVPTNEQDVDPDVNPADSLNCAFTWYYTFTIIVAMTATSIFIRINVWLKFIIHSATIVFYIIINNPPTTMFETLKQFFQTQGNNWSILDHKYELSHLFYIVMIAVILHLIDRQVEYILSLNIQWNEQLESDRIESQTVGEINRILLENILPPHVLKRYLYNTTVSYDQLYHESHPSCAVMFASIPNYESFYTENNLNEQGLKCLQLLNEIICDFDQLLSLPFFRTIEKIKTIGSTYMAACFEVNRRHSDCGTIIDTPELCSDHPSSSYWQQQQQQHHHHQTDNQIMLTGHHNHHHHHHSHHHRQQLAKRLSRNSNCDLDRMEMSNVVTMVCFATALMQNLKKINQDAFQEFRLRIGIAIGPVIAGVVGASKPTYDIWGDTVNVASRLESSGISGRIQVSERVAQLLEQDGRFELECRGPVHVKGKGQLTTYLVVTEFDNIDDAEPVAATTESRPVMQATGIQAATATDNQSIASMSTNAECGLNSERDVLELSEPPPALNNDDDDDGVDDDDDDGEKLCSSMYSDSKKVTNGTGNSVNFSEDKLVANDDDDDDVDGDNDDPVGS